MNRESYRFLIGFGCRFQDLPPGFQICRVTPQKASNPTYRDYFWIIPDHGLLNKDYPHGLCTAGGHKKVLKLLRMLLDYSISFPDSLQRNIEN
ncbi:MAG: hypothetical protein VXW26_06045 [SAR324 cluster bacterium]|nr:hypothetical protein [SAR324 cluster bacterium]